MILHYGKKSLFWSLIIFGYLIFTTVRGQKNRFQRLWMYKIFKHRKLPCIPCLGETHFKSQWYIFPSLFSFFCFCNATFFHSGYVIKPPQPSSAIYGAPPFTGHRLQNQTYIQWKCPEMALQCQHRHCATHCKPETKKTGDRSNAFLFIQFSETSNRWPQQWHRSGLTPNILYCLA